MNLILNTLMPWSLFAISVSPLVNAFLNKDEQTVSTLTFYKIYRLFYSFLTYIHDCLTLDYFYELCQNKKEVNHEFVI